MFKYIYMIISFAYMAGLWKVKIISIFVRASFVPLSTNSWNSYGRKFPLKCPTDESVTE